MTEKNNIEALCMNCMSAALVDGICPKCGLGDNDYQPSPHHLPPRTILGGKYLIGRVLGEGGFGITYLGWDLNLDIKIAIKEYFPAGFVTRENTMTNTVTPFTGEKTQFFQNGREKFVEEAKRLAKFYSLPGIVSIKDFFMENGTAYIVMEYVEGENLKQYLAKMGGKAPAAMIFELMKPLMNSLIEIHKAGIIHRDISPDNLMITREGNIKLIDFGAARDYENSGNKSLSVMLKPGYAPEEQYRTRGVQGPWTDIYALCATIYKAITGVTPDESIERTRHDELAAPSRLGADILPYQEMALMKGMSVFQEERFHNVNDLITNLYHRPDQNPSESEVREEQTTNNQIQAALNDINNSGNQDTDSTGYYKDREIQPENKLKQKKKIGYIVAAALVLCFIGILIYYSNYKSSQSQNDQSTVQADNELPVTQSPVTQAGTVITPVITAAAENNQTDSNSGSIGDDASADDQNTAAGSSQPTVTVMADNDTSSAVSADSGNTSGNIINGGHFAAQGDWVYYSLYDCLCKMKADGSERTVLHKGLCNSLAVQGDWIYFCNVEDNETLYRIKTDGSKITKLDDSESCRCINAASDWIYYSTWKEGTYKIRPDGSEKTLLVDDTTYEMTVAGDYIYYGTNPEFNSIKTDGTESSCLIDSAYTVNVADGWIYYEDDNLYKVRTDGTNKTKLNDEQTQDINVSGDWIYYTIWKESSKQSILYKMRTDGTEVTKLYKVGGYDINVIGDWIYYASPYDSYYYRIRTDGSGNKKLKK